MAMWQHTFGVYV